MSEKTKFLIVLLLVVCVVPTFVFAQKYTTYTASSNLKKQLYKNSDTVLIVSNGGDFLWNRIMEETLQSEFIKKGVSVCLLTDYMDISDSEEIDSEEFFGVLLQTRAKFLLEVVIGDMYTYTVGDGISKFDSNAELVTCSNYDVVLRIGLSTESDTNDALSFGASRKPAIESAAKGLVEEYMKYVK